MTVTQMSHDQRQDMSAAAMRTYPNIARDWQLKEQEAALLLGVSGSTYSRWQKQSDKATLDVDRLERMSLILGIYKALQTLLPHSDTADSWLRRPNHHPLFCGQAPLELLSSGMASDLHAVRQYLEAPLGGDYI